MYRIYKIKLVIDIADSFKIDCDNFKITKQCPFIQKYQKTLKTKDFLKINSFLLLSL